MTTHARPQAARIRPDRPAVAGVAVALATVVAAAAFAVSFASLSSIGAALGLGPAAWLVPVMIDGAILSATGLVLVEKARARAGVLPWSIVYGATAASSVANIAEHMTAGDGVLAASVAGIAPVVLLVLTHAITSVLVEEVDAPAAERDEASEPVSEAEPVAVAEPVAAVVEAVVPVPEAAARPAVAASPKPRTTARTRKPKTKGGRAATSPVPAEGGAPWAEADEEERARRRAEAMAAVAAGAESQSAVARRIGVPRSTLQMWVKEEEPAAAEGGSQPVIEAAAEPAAEAPIRQAA